MDNKSGKTRWKVPWSIGVLIVYSLLALGSKDSGDKPASEPDKDADTKPARVASSSKSPEQQFREFQQRRMGPSVKILSVVMNEQGKKGNRVLYEGFYTHKLDVRGLIGAKEETVFFTAVFVNGKMSEWMPSR